MRRTILFTSSLRRTLGVALVVLVTGRGAVFRMPEF